MAEFAGMLNLNIWYAKLDSAAILDRWGTEAGQPGPSSTFSRVAAKAETRDRLKATAKLTHEVDGELRFLSDPPLLVPVEDLFADADALEDRGHRAGLAPGLPPHPAGGPAAPARDLPLLPPGPEGGRGGQRRHPLLGGAVRRP